MKITNDDRNNLYSLDRVDNYTNGADNPLMDGKSPRQYLHSKLSKCQGQLKLAELKAKAEEARIAKIKRQADKLKSLKPLGTAKDPNYKPHFNLPRSKEVDLTDEENARIESFIDEQMKQHKKKPPSKESTSTSSTVSNCHRMPMHSISYLARLTSFASSTLLQGCIFHLPAVYMFIAFAPLFELLLRIDTGEETCSLQYLEKIIHLHTDLNLDDVTSTGMHDTYDERWKNDEKQMIKDIAFGLSLRLGGQSARGAPSLGKGWTNNYNNEHDHNTQLDVKEDGVGSMRWNGRPVHKMMLEILKCNVENQCHHDRGQKNHKEKLMYEMMMLYDFDKANITSCKCYICFGVNANLTCV